MSKEIYISSTPHETRLAIVENDALTEIYYERENEYSLAGSIYNGKVTRVLPGMQSSFVDIGLDRDAFLYITDFMEEAGDAADFESHANGRDASRDQSRAPREGGGRSDSRRTSSDRGERTGRDANGNRDNRDNREEQPRLGAGASSDQAAAHGVVREPSDAELFTDAVSGLDPARPVSGAERGRSRRGGRSGRDRNSDGTPRRDRGPERVSGNRADSGNRIDLPRAEPVRPEAPPQILAAPPSVENSGELGEGAPGADGSRRWRGRRGRRGTRSDAPREASAAETTSLSESPAAESRPIYESYDDGSSETDSTEGFSESPEAQQPAAAVTDSRGSRNGRGGREERGREGREDRGDRGDRGNRGDRSAPPRVPRGFAPSTSLYQVDGVAAETTAYGEEADMAPPSEPIILPGESLSKYRPGGNESAAPQSLAPTPAASQFVVAGWDGGNVLPGETIRPRAPRTEDRSAAPGAGQDTGRGASPHGGQRNDAPRRDSGSREASRDSSGGASRGDDRQGRGGRDSRGGNRGRDERGGRGDRQDRQDRQDRSGRTPRTESSLAAAPLTPMRHDPAPVPTQTTTHSEESVPLDVLAHEQVAASHAATPIDSTFVPPPPMPDQAVEAHHVPVAAIAAEQEYEPSEASASYRVDPIPPSEFRQAAPVAEEEAAAELAGTPEPDAAAHAHALSETGMAPSEHQLTSISATGEMHSEPVELTTQDLTAPAPSAQGTLQSNEPQPAEIAAGDQSLPYFAPGAGLLEEETLDEEEYVPPAPRETQSVTLQAHADSEQETLEGAADLGSMIEEMAIDRTTRGEPAMDDEDDDDLLEEDQDFEESEFEEEDGEDADDSEDSEDSRQEPRGFAETRGDDDDESGRELEQAAYGSAVGSEPAHHSNGSQAAGTAEAREPRRNGRSSREPERRDGRRDGRGGDRNGRSGSGSADRGSRGSFSSSSSSGERDRDRGRGRGRQSVQATNLPAISDLLKPGQEVLVQIAKEPIAKKGARITSHIALPGRFLVFMPTVGHTGVSRKIESDAERRRLKEILLSEKGEAAGGFIVRTAASGASEEELRSDLRFLLNLWTDIKNRSEGSKSPALIYHDLNLVERVLRDQVTDTFSAIWVDTETEYERVLRFLQRFQPSLIRRVKLYTKEVPLFEQFGITEEINKALRSKVWLKSGGSIVINQTEALVAIDINTGKFVGKTARLEDTIVKTNLDAIPEIVRQIRLRDLGGIIIIDFIDMDDRKNRNRVMAALEDELKADRAPSKVLQFNDFGLVAITRKRVKQSLERTLSTTCGVCQGTGMVKSPITVCNDIYIEMRKMHKHLDRGDVMLRVHPEVVKQLKSTTSRWLQEMEEMVGRTILVKSDPSLHPEQFDLH